MKNTSNDINILLIAQLERLSEDDLTEEELKKEIKKSSAMAELSLAIANNHRNELTAIKMAMENGFIQKESFNNILNLNKTNK